VIWCQHALPLYWQILDKKGSSNIEKQKSLILPPTAWLKPHARTLKERTYEHQPTALPHGISVGIGQGYIAILNDFLYLEQS
jgi:hypothetical protein